MITKDWEWTMISLAQQIHRSHIIGNQDHQKLNKKKIRERESNNIFCVRKLCTESERELEIYNKKMRIRRAKNKGRQKG